MKKFALISLILISGFFLAQFRVHAQTPGPQFLITWQAKTYAPPDFSGRILPTANSLITASFDLIDGSKSIDLSNQVVYWYLNDNLLQSGQGIQGVSFAAPGAAGGTLDLRVELPNYKDGSFLKTIEIPVVRPQAVIEPGFPDNRFSNLSLQLAGRPYFFNVQNPKALNFLWRIGDQSPSGSENPDVLNVNLNADAPAGANLNINLTIQNPADALESASQALSLTYMP